MAIVGCRWVGCGRGVEPSTSASSAASSALQLAKQLAEARAAARRARARRARVGDQRAEPRPVEPRVLGRQRVERVGLGEQPIAPLLQRVLPRGVDRRAVRPGVEPRAGSASGSTSRISWPMNCICRSRAPRAVMPRAARSPRPAARAARLRPRARQAPGSSATSASPRSCSACISALRRVFDGGGGLGVARAGARSSVGARRCAGGRDRRRGMGGGEQRWSGSGRDGEPFAMIADADHARRRRRPRTRREESVDDRANPCAATAPPPIARP